MITIVYLVISICLLQGAQQEDPAIRNAALERVDPFYPEPPRLHRSASPTPEVLSVADAQEHLAVGLHQLRNQDLLKAADNLLLAQKEWYWWGNVFETLGTAARYLAPFFSGLAAGLKNSEMGFLAMGLGLGAEAFMAFARYAHQESRERGTAANQIFVQAGLPSVPLFRSNSGLALSSNERSAKQD